MSREATSVKCYVTLLSFSKSIFSLYLGDPQEVLSTVAMQEEHGLLPSWEQMLWFLHKIEQKSFIWVISWLFPHLSLEMKPPYNSFLDSPRIFGEINHQPRTVPRPLWEDVPWSVSRCLSRERKKKNLFC